EDITQTIPHNQLVACDYLYVSYYYDGLWVYDIADPANPVPVLQYDSSTWPFDNNYRGAWGVYPFLPSGNILLIDMQEGLFVFEGPGDACGDRDQSIIACDAVSNTNDLVTNAAFTVYPQPASHYVQVKLGEGSPEQLAQLQLVDLQGRPVADFGERWLGPNAIDLLLPNLASGVYLLEAKVQGQTIVKKVLLQ
ncbi:MAG: T9SS type A sorting domain-containing protein, partial [Bacteroidota bacterium]